jgi:transcriptional regulator GlxA family with amidase domain
MRIGFLVFDGMTTLDFLGVFDAVTRIRTMGFRDDLEWKVCGRSPVVRDGAGLILQVEEVGRGLDGYDMIVVPGGFAGRQLESDAGFVEWLRTAAEVEWKASACTGSLLLGAAGFLEGWAATTHPSAYEVLAEYCREVRRERIVEDGKVITARGVTSSVDLGLYLVEKITGTEARERIRVQMDYPAGVSDVFVAESGGSRSPGGEG